MKSIHGSWTATSTQQAHLTLHPAVPSKTDCCCTNAWDHRACIEHLQAVRISQHKGPQSLCGWATACSPDDDAHCSTRGSHTSCRECAIVRVEADGIHRVDCVTALLTAPMAFESILPRLHDAHAELFACWQPGFTKQFATPDKASCPHKSCPMTDPASPEKRVTVQGKGSPHAVDPAT